MSQSNDKYADTMSVAQDAGQIDLAQISRYLWTHRMSGIVVLVVTFLAAVLYLHLATYKYTATLVVVPADQSGADLPGGLAGLGSLVGIGLSSQQGSSFALYDDAIKSQAVAIILSRDQKIMTVAFSDQWDAKVGEWVERPSLAKSLIRLVKSALGVPVRAWSPPSPEDLTRFIDENMVIVEDKLNAKLTVSFEHPNKNFAAYFLAAANYQADEFLRSSSLARTTAYANYLERRLSQVTVAEYRVSLAETLSAYEKTRMMASASVSFSAEKFGDVWVSSKPTYPVPFLVIFTSMTVGFLVWIACIIILKYFKRNHHRNY